MQVEPVQISKTRTRYIVAAILLLHAALLAHAATANSVTFDEFVHLPSGVANLKYHDLSICCVSPPLVRWWAAGFAMMAGAEGPDAAPLAVVHPDSKHWVYGRMFQNGNRSRYHTLFVVARLAMIPISCAAAWIVFCWAGRLYGAAAGLAACAMYCLCPNVLAHGSLVTTDVATATVMLASLYLWQRFTQTLRWSSVIGASLAIGAAQLCKFSALMLWPILLAATVMACRGRDWGARRRLIGGFVAAAVISLLMINAAYGFAGTGRSVGSYAFESKACAGLSRLPAWLPIPLPRDYVVGFDIQKGEAEGMYSALLLDRVYDGSVWYYYPVALFCKLPFTVIVCAGAAVFFEIRRMRDGRIGDAGLILGAILFFVATAALLGDINIGVRYLMPIFPLGFILIGGLWRDWSGWRRPALAVVIIGMALENASAAPRYLTFFNPVVQASATERYRLLNDSNFDWGQGLIDLRKWMEQNGVKSVGLFYFGSVDPGVYGINYRLINDVQDEQYIAVSSYFVAGLSHRLPGENGQTDFVRIPFYRELQRQKPVAAAGETIFIYRRADFAQAIAEYRTGHPG